MERATTLTSLISWEVFEQLPDDGMHRELIEGELIELPPAKSKHSWIARRIVRVLRPLDDGDLAAVFFEAGYRLSARSWIQPDVSVLTRERATASSPDGYFHSAPELAVEVVSPSETARDLNRKVDLLLANGSLAVWVIYPEEQEVRVFLADGTGFVRGMDGTLGVPEILGALEIPVAQLFEI
jgi:Uma2 family endonuclease